MSIFQRHNKRAWKAAAANVGHGGWVQGLRQSMLFLDGLKEFIQSRIWALSSSVEIDDHKPDFIGIGAQKAATTWLDFVLRKHRSFRLPVGRKEVHFFDRNRWKGRRWYFWHFRGGGADKIKGEITPAYSTLTDLSAVEEINPDIKVVFVLRNPVERAISMAKMDLGLNAAEEKRGAVSEDDILAHIQSSKSVDRGRYTETIYRWHQLVGKDRFLIVFYDELLERPQDLLEKVLKFLGADPAEFDWDDLILKERVHSGSRSHISQSIHRLASRLYRDEIISLDHLLQSEYTARWRQEIEELEGS